MLNQRYSVIVVLISFVIKVQSCEDESWCATLPDACITRSVAEFCPKKCKMCLEDRCGSCQQNCTLLDGGPKYRCTCNEGYRLNEDLKTCSDINECEQDPLICGMHKFCKNKVDGYECIPDPCTPFLHMHYVRSYSQPSKCCKMTRGTCGQNNQNRNARGIRIVSGEDASAGMWPWQAMILPKGRLCGGTLINKGWVVAAANCFSAYKNTRRVSIDVFFGVLNSSNVKVNTAQRRKIVQVIKHERFKFPNNDIALAKLNGPIQPSDYVSPVCLPNGEVPKDGTRCFATGFGITDPNSQIPAQHLQQVDLPIVNIAACRKAYLKSTYSVHPKTMICAGHKDGGKDACLGDTGGPLVCQRCDSCDWYLAGITSFGQGCASAQFPGVFTNVEFYEKWIASKINSVKVTKRTCQPTQWSNWGDWTKCSKQCGSGGQSRIRICRNGRANLPGCLGRSFEKVLCNTQPCGVGPWASWTACSKSCGGGKQTRTTRCKLANCERLTESRECNTQSCPEWRQWSQWSDCSKTCQGTRSRTRSCDNAGGGTCIGQRKQTETCNEGPKWGSWSTWGSCNVECGNGEQISTRSCACGTNCVGKPTRSRTCNEKECPGRFSPWGDWGKCSASCGQGTQERRRFCPKTSCIPDDFGSSLKNTQSCNIISCVGRWSTWDPWSDCSQSCGVGTRSRARVCTGGLECLGSQKQNENCSTKICVGSWSVWSHWTPCDATCGESVKLRQRSCKDGVNCPGENTEIRSCSLIPCATWSLWSEWSGCDTTCGGGVSERRRSCENGDNCIGDANERVVCSSEPCPTWSQWSGWSSCDATCGEGTRIQKRSCQNGNNCNGSASQSEACITKVCLTWSDWQAWGKCSKSCAGGQRSRKRTCGKDEGDKDQCEGADSETENCSEQPCPSLCDSRCQSQVLTGWCQTHREWMERACHGDCCSKEHCRDIHPSCNNFDQQLCYTNENFRDNCLSTCGYCP